MVEVLTHWLNGDDYKHRSNGFMGKSWDSFVPGPAVWREVYRVLKPGAMALVFGGTRTYDLTTIALRLAGFQIRDCVMWLHSQGFPKGHDISVAIDRAAGAERKTIGDYGRSFRPHANGSNEGWLRPSHEVNGKITAPATTAAQTWHGYNVALKPAWEPIIVAMKPIDKTFANNALQHGVAGLWIDGCRVSIDSIDDIHRKHAKSHRTAKNTHFNGLGEHDYSIPSGRFPANVIHDGSPEVMAEFARYGERKSGKAAASGHKRKASLNANSIVNVAGRSDENAGMLYGDSGSIARFFYCAKSSRSERTNGGKVENGHPCVKPLALCRYLARLTKTPAGGIVLDPFMGSGSVGIAALLEGRDFIGIEMNEGNYQTAVKRIEDWQERIQRHGEQVEMEL
jgi:site-specific DNA-methyltransferase (adenine-specific)